ncbi:MAG: DUF488 family protein [Planctomycetota bacterium JB042]
MIRTANVTDYENLPPREEAYRVLVMRKWPRGVPKDEIDHWMKDLGASPDLLKEYKKGKVTAAGLHSRYMAEVSEPGRRELVLGLQQRMMNMNGKDLLLLCDGESEDGCVRNALKDILETT